MAKPPAALPLAMEQPGSAYMILFQMRFAADNVAQQCPAFRILPGMVVTLRTVNGSVVNANACQIADSPEGAIHSWGGTAIPPGADVTLPWPVENTGQIWAAGEVGDGLLITIQKQQIG
jgi:hypothetical protein